MTYVCILQNFKTFQTGILNYTQISRKLQKIYGSKYDYTRSAETYVKKILTFFYFYYAFRSSLKDFTL